MSLNWVGSHTALLALVVTAIAVALALTNTLLNWQHRKQDAYLTMHDLLTTPEMSRGRRLVREIGRSGRIPPDGSDDYQTINRVLSAHNNLAMYVRRGVISKSWALDGWHHTLRDLAVGTIAFIDHRMGRDTWRLYVDLEGLIADAGVYRSRRPCCAGMPLKPHAVEQGEN